VVLAKLIIAGTRSKVYRSRRSVHGIRTNYDNPCSFSHAITGDTSLSPPHEATGGIIADAMGLGKSLTVLAAIVGSLERAASFAREALHMARPGFDGASGAPVNGRIVVKTTLIVVPSICE
jgi:SNF2 family DNA or RNA helicase